MGHTLVCMLSPHSPSLFRHTTHHISTTSTRRRTETSIFEFRWGILLTVKPERIESALILCDGLFQMLGVCSMFGSETGNANASPAGLQVHAQHSPQTFPGTNSYLDVLGTRFLGVGQGRIGRGSCSGIKRYRQRTPSSQKGVSRDGEFFCA